MISPVSPASTLPPASFAGPCLDCGATRVGEYCHACGQQRQAAFTFLAVSIPFALLLRLFFRRSLNLAEALVFSLYALGQGALRRGIVSPAVALAGGGFRMYIAGALVLHLVVCAQAAVGFFGRRPAPVLGTVLALGLGFLLFVGFAGPALVAVALLAG